MLTFEQAREKALETILKLAREVGGQEFAILDDRVSERARGWMFPYNTRKFVETRNVPDGVGGNGPIFVDRNNETVHILPSGGYSNWMDEYDRTGVPPRAPTGRMRWVGEGPAQSFPSPSPRKSKPPLPHRPDQKT
jgi:Immunity protein 35